MLEKPCVAGWVEAITGGMFSGKTEELHRRMRLAVIARQKVQLFKPLLDNRYSDKNEAVSHNLNTFPATPFDHQNPGEILNMLEDHVRVIGITEAQFCASAEILGVVQQLAGQGYRVILDFLNQDAAGNVFGPAPFLLAIADEITKLTAVCMQCGSVATRSQRISDGGERVKVGSSEDYEARCNACFVPVRGSEDPTAE